MHYEITFVGQVQGVGFRATAHGLARRHRVAGWVRNESDGTVSLAVEGDDATVDAYLADLRDRMGGVISDERILRTPERRGYTGFEIRR